MPVTDLPTVAFGDGVLASRLDQLLQAADDRLARLYSNRTWYAFNTAGIPSQQVPPAGAVYVLSDDADRVLLPVPGTPGAPDGGNWPEQYDHDAHVAAAAALTITGPDDHGIAWQTSAGYSSDVYASGDAASVLEREDTDEDLGTLTMPLRYASAYEPERFHRYALADVFIEAAEATEFDWFHDKYGVIRVHNLSRHEISLSLGDGDEETLAVPSMGVRCIRRTSRTGEWDHTVRYYFPKALPGDVPIWDGSTNHMDNRPLRSQNANPIFRVALIQSMFRPQALQDGPGLYSSTINDVLSVPGDEGLLAAAMVQNGEFEVIRTRSDEPGTTESFTFSYAGEVLDGVTSEDLAEALEGIGLVVAHDDDTRGIVLGPDPGFPPPDDFDLWAYDVISRGTNLSGGIIVSVGSGRVLLPWFVDATAADAWFTGLFHWPIYSVVKTGAPSYWKEGTWTPTGGGHDTDYCGSWAQDGDDIEARQFVADWGSTSLSTIAPWNLFSTTIGEAIALVGDGGSADRQFARLVVHPILTAVVCEETVGWWSPDDDEDWDNACAIRPRIPGGGGIGGPGIYVAGSPIGLGWLNDDGTWTEPRWQIHLLPTIGADPQTSWDALGLYGSEEIIWTPLLPADSGSGTLTHWRVDGGEGVAGGSDWAWNYGSEGPTPEGDEPAGEVMSGMLFWRVVAQITRPPGESGTYAGKPETGPQPWKARDHGWLADQILAGAPIAAGDPWSVGRADCWDNVAIMGEGPEIRPDEAKVGMQIRMTAATLNGVSALVSGVTHVRPLGWENFLNGFSFGDLREQAGWTINNGGLGTEGYGILQPYGAAHIYGGDDPYIDAKLDALGVIRRTAESATLQVLQTIELREYFLHLGLLFPFVALGMVDRPLDESFRAAGWTEAGNEIEYCTPDDIHEALQAYGFSFNYARLIQPMTMATYVPGEDIETQTDTVDEGFINFPGTAFRSVINQTTAIPVPDDGDEPELQQSANVHFTIAAERSSRAQIHIKRPDVGSSVKSIRRIGPVSGVEADVLARLRAGEWGQGALSDSRSVWWFGHVLCRTDLTVTVMCVPYRRLIADGRAADDTGPRAVTEQEWGVPLVLPDASARVKFLTATSGGRIGLTEIIGTETPDFPDGHHVWELHVLPADLEPI